MPAGGREEEKKYKNALFCNQAFYTCIECLVPKLRAAKTLDDTLLEPFRYCPFSWGISAAAMRQMLTEVSKNWKKLGLAGSCPYLPTEEELVEHKKQYEFFESVQKVKLWLMRTLATDSDGWVPIDAWEGTKVAHREVFEQWMQREQAKTT